MRRLLGCLKFEGRLNRTNPKSELTRMGSKRRLTSLFGRIKNVKNFDVEKMVLLKNCVLQKALSEHALRKNATEMISVYDYESVVI
jgi:hypothetical protein